MKSIALTSLQKEKLEKRHAKSHDSRECDRIKAVLLYSEGWNTPMISQALRLHETTILRHLNDYKNNKLQTENGGSKSELNDKQTAELITHIEGKLYHHVHEIIEYVESKFSVSYSVPGMNKWLHRNSFSYKKPKGFPYKADEEQQKKFINKYKRLKRRIGENELIVFMDSVHPSQATKLEYGWIRTGQTRSIETTASRTRINLVGAIDLSNLAQAHTADYETINGASIVDFLKQLREKYTSLSTLHLILDKAGYHRSEAVAKAAKKLDIKLHFLPAYSPNLNPIERLWKVMNEQVRNNRFFKSAKDFKEAIKYFFEKRLPDIANGLTSRINDNFQILKNPAS